MSAIQPMTYLDLVRRLRQEGRSTGVSTTPTTVEGTLTGDTRDWADWIAESWHRIQMAKQGWRWMYDDVEIAINTTDRDYDLTDAFPVQADRDRFSYWKWGGCKYKVTSEGLAGERPVPHLLWENHVRADYGTVLTAQRPSRIIIMPDDALRLQEKVSEVGTLTARYYKAPQTLALDEDEPEMPAEFHMLIVWDALVDHAVGDLAQEQLVRAERRRDQLWYQLVNRQLEPVVNYAKTMG